MGKQQQQLLEQYHQLILLYFHSLEGQQLVQGKNKYNLILIYFTSSPQPSFFSFFRKEQPRKKELINEIQQPNQFLIEPVARLFGV